MIALAAAAILCLSATPQAASPAPPAKKDVSAQLKPAFGNLPELAWKTYLLDLTNDTGRDQDLVCSIAEAGSGARAERREKLPAGSRKRLFLYLQNQYGGGRIRLLVRDAAGRELVDETVNEIWHRPSGRGSTGTVGLLGIALMDRAPVHKPGGSDVVVCPEASFPDRWIGLEGFHFAIMRDYKLDALMPAQRQALLDWVRRGGTIYLTAGSNRDWLLSRPVQELAPVELGPSSELTRFEALEAAFGDFRERTPFVYHRIVNGEALGDSKPVSAVRFRQGAGLVVALPFDLERAPFDSWPGGAGFRDHLQAKAAGALAPRSARISTATADIEQAATQPVTTMPSFLILLAISGVFIIVVGPVNYLVLRRLNKTLLIVVTVPAISIFFMLVVVGTGQIIRGTSTVTFDACLLEAREGDDCAVETRLLCLQSASNRSYDLEWPGATAATAGSTIAENQKPWGGHYRHNEESAIRPTFDQTDRWTLRECAFNQWQTGSFLGRSLRPLGGSITFTFDGGALKIRNGTSMAILHGLLVDGSPALLTQGLVQTFEAVGAGETRTFAQLPRAMIAAQVEEGTLEDRILDAWLPTALGSSLGQPFLLCVMAPPADEIRINAGTSARSERVCLLQVFPERP